MHPRKLIGITGGIGSGKTIVCKIFETLGIPVFNADQASKKIVATDPSLKNEIIALLGEKAYENGVYNNKYVAQKVFSSPELLLKLNQLIHPKVRVAAQNWLEKQDKKPYYLYEAALMEAAGQGNNIDKIIVVTAPIALRIARIKERDGRTEVEIEAIINKQKTDAERKKISDFEVVNDSESALIPQVLKIHKAIIAT